MQSFFHDFTDMFEQNRQRWSWLALRTARDQYLQHFGKIGTGDVVLLANEIEIEKERDKNQKMQKAEEMVPTLSSTQGNEDRKASKAGDATGTAGIPLDVEGDVKMEDR
jgi:hypothetical protein